MRLVLTLTTAACALLAACGGGSGTGAGAGDGRPHVVVSSSIVGDVVATVLGDQATTELLMPLGADPHDFSPSSRQVAEMADADLVVAVGAGFEHGMEDVLANVESDGARVLRLAEHVDLLQSDGGDDPHFWTDPTRVAAAVEALVAELSIDPGFDSQVLRERADDYLARLEALDAEVEQILAPIPGEDRVLVTDHEVFGYFADRYGFEVVGAVVPSLSTGAAPSAADVAALADVIEERGVRAIFGSTTQPRQLAEALAAEVGREVEVVDLFTESLGEPGSGGETYLDLVRTDAQRIVEALT